MKEIMDLTGQRFGRLEVLHESDRTPYGARRWLCECDCGKRKIVFQDCLMKGKSRSCGCLRTEELVARFTKHGCCGSRIYNIYAKMKRRCYVESEERYEDYGGRGIRVCSEWLGEQGFENFHKWAMKNGYTDNLTIDRIDVNGNYEPSNCRWATYEEQSKNKRNNIVVTWNGKTQVLKDWCRELSLDYRTIKARFHKGWDIDRMFTEPIKKIDRVS